MEPRNKKTSSIPAARDWFRLYVEEGPGGVRAHRVQVARGLGLRSFFNGLPGPQRYVKYRCWAFILPTFRSVGRGFKV